MRCFPLDNTPYEAKDMGTFLSTRTRGVYSDDDNLAVMAGASGMSVSVLPGIAWLKWSDYWGAVAVQDQAITLSLDAADGVLNRTDAIVCRINKVSNKSEIVVKKGAFSSVPVIEDPVHNDSFDEIYLATIFVNAGATSVTASMITDQRLNEDYCGIMRDGVTGIPTQVLYAQASEMIEELQRIINDVLDGSEYMLKTVYDPENVNTQLQPKTDAAFNTQNKTVTGAVNEVIQNQFKIVKLWTNSDISAAFPAQTINLDLSGYDAVSVYSPAGMTTGMVDNVLVRMSQVYTYDVPPTAGGIYFRRDFTVTPTGVTFTNCFLNTSTTPDGRLLVPKFIFGIKFNS